MAFAAVVALGLLAPAGVLPGVVLAAGGVRGDSLTLVPQSSGQGHYASFGVGFAVNAGFPGGTVIVKANSPASPCASSPAAHKGAEFDFSGGEDYDRVPPGPVTWTPANSNMAVTSALSPGRHLVCAWLTEDGTNKVVAATHLVVTAPIFVWDPDNSACWALSGPQVAQAFAISPQNQMSSDNESFPGEHNDFPEQDSSVCEWSDCSASVACTSPIGGLLLYRAVGPARLANMVPLNTVSLPCRPVPGVGTQACAWIGLEVSSLNGSAYRGTQLFVVKGHLGLSLAMFVISPNAVPTVRRDTGHPVDSPSVDTPTRLLSDEARLTRIIFSLIPAAHQ